MISLDSPTNHGTKKEMILESMFSCSCLLLVCGSSVYTLRKESHDGYKRLLPRFTWACLGIVAFGARSLLVLGYKLFLKDYTSDPAAIEIEEERNRSRTNVLDEVLRSLGTAGLVYSVCSENRRPVLGACVVTGASLLDAVRCLESRKTQGQDVDVTGTGARRYVKAGRVSLCWVLFNVCFAYAVRNNYGLAANYPYFITIWALPAEGFYQGWTITRTVNDYLTAAYVLLMTEALRRGR